MLHFISFIVPSVTFLCLVKQVRTKFILGLVLLHPATFIPPMVMHVPSPDPQVCSPWPLSYWGCRAGLGSYRLGQPERDPPLHLH